MWSGIAGITRVGSRRFFVNFFSIVIYLNLIFRRSEKFMPVKIFMVELATVIRVRILHHN
jgi:hypothetical protein